MVPCSPDKTSTRSTSACISARPRWLVASGAGISGRDGGTNPAPESDTTMVQVLSDDPMLTPKASPVAWRMALLHASATARTSVSSRSDGTELPCSALAHERAADGTADPRAETACSFAHPSASPYPPGPSHKRPWTRRLPHAVVSGSTSRRRHPDRHHHGHPPARPVDRPFRARIGPPGPHPRRWRRRRRRPQHRRHRGPPDRRQRARRPAGRRRRAPRRAHRRALPVHPGRGRGRRRASRRAGRGRPWSTTSRWRSCGWWSTSTASTPTRPAGASTW